MAEARGGPAPARWRALLLGLAVLSLAALARSAAAAWGSADGALGALGAAAGLRPRGGDEEAASAWRGSPRAARCPRARVAAEGWQPRSRAALDALSTGNFSWREAAGEFEWVPEEAQAAAAYRARSRPELLRCLRDRRLYFMGTSFTRELRNSVLTILQGFPVTLEQVWVPSYALELVTDASECARLNPGKDVDLHRGQPFCARKRAGSKISCNLPGPAGIDLVGCDLPWNRSDLVTEGCDGVSVHFQFKTYVNTREADAVVLDRWSRLPAPDLIVLGSAEWGVTGWQRRAKDGKWVEDEPPPRNEAVDEYFRSVVQAYPRTRKLHTSNPGYNRSSKSMSEWIKARMATDPTFLMLNVDKFAGAKRDSHAHEMRDGHGHEGPIVDAMAWSLLLTLCDDLTIQADPAGGAPQPP
jgi:hypothetical protein